MNVSRQAVNMWENKKKSLSHERKQELCEIFGLDNPELFDKISATTKEELEAMLIFRMARDSQNEQFSFKGNENNHKFFCQSK